MNTPPQKNIKQLKRPRVAITGIGMVTPLGHNTAATWQGLMDKTSAIDTISLFDASHFTSQIAAEVRNFDFDLNMDKKLQRSTIRSSRFALQACEEALQDAGIRPTAATAERWGCSTGSAMITAEYEFWEEFQKEFAADGTLDIKKLGTKGLSSISPSEYAAMQNNCGLGLITKQFNIRGYTISVHTACASGGQALGIGLQALRRGDVDYMLAGGYDSMINPIGVAGFCLLGALSTYNDTPQTACRPFDLTRKGFVLGEGACFMVLENMEKAKARGAHIYAELAGEGNSLSSYRITDSHPSGDGAIQAIQNALHDADVSAQQVDYINAHGTSTQMNDLSETNAVKAVFQEHAKQIPMSSTKAQTGHLISAAGAVEGAIAALTISKGTVPMTRNLTTPDPDCDLDYVVEGPREKSVGIAMSNSFGFGGTNNSLVFKHPELV